MEAKKGRVKNKYSQIVVSANDLCELLLSGKNIDRLVTESSEEIDKFKQLQRSLLDQPIELNTEEDFNMTVEDFHEQSSSQWLFPKEYQQIDVLAWLLDKCKTQEQVSRVNEEYRLYDERNLVMLLRLFIYLVDYMRRNGFVWGVGRGSSVSSYILFLIGVHRVDSLKYKLDINEYLK